MEIKNTPLNVNSSLKESIRKPANYWNYLKMKTHKIKPLRYIEKGPKRELYRAKCLQFFLKRIGKKELK